MKNCTKFVGMDLHKKTIAVAISEKNGVAPNYLGTIPNTNCAVVKMVKKLSQNSKQTLFCYEAGPCGYHLYRQLQELGQKCIVVAPSMIPKKTGDRIKTDKRDAITLSRLLRSGDLTPVWVPDKAHESIRDLCRARIDMKKALRQAQQQLTAFLLRNGIMYTRKKSWKQDFFRWLETLKFETQTQQIVFQEYVDTVKQIQQRANYFKDEIAKVVETWSFKPIITDLMALRGVQLLSAVTIIAELGDLTRFETAHQLMAYLGLVPSEYSTGSKRRQGGITKTGNYLVRSTLVESSWAYRFPARKTNLIQRRAEKASEEAQKIAWEAQKRLCKRYTYLTRIKSKPPVVAVVSIARELSGFVWAIAQQSQNRIFGGSKNNIAI